MGLTQGNSTLVIAHRGASLDAPENTIPAFIKAWEINADAIEFDIRETLDNELVCIHDANLERVTRRTDAISEVKYSDLSKIDVGLWRDKKFKNTFIPTLAEIIKIKPKNKMAFVEIKPSEISLEKLRNFVAKRDLVPEEFHFLCFYPRIINLLKENFPQFKVTASIIPAFIDYEFKKIKRIIEKYDSYGISMHVDSKKSINLIKKLKEDGKFCLAWTVNSKEMMRDLLAVNVDGIITDNPKELITIKEEMRIE